MLLAALAPCASRLAKDSRQPRLCRGYRGPLVDALVLPSVSGPREAGIFQRWGPLHVLQKEPKPGGAAWGTERSTCSLELESTRGPTPSWSRSAADSGEFATWGKGQGLESTGQAKYHVPCPMDVLGSGGGQPGAGSPRAPLLAARPGPRVLQSGAEQGGLAQAFFSCFCCNRC